MKERETAMRLKRFERTRRQQGSRARHMIREFERSPPTSIADKAEEIAAASEIRAISLLNGRQVASQGRDNLRPPRFRPAREVGAA